MCVPRQTSSPDAFPLKKPQPQILTRRCIRILGKTHTSLTCTSPRVGLRSREGLYHSTLSGISTLARLVLGASGLGAEATVAVGAKLQWLLVEKLNEGRGHLPSPLLRRQPSTNRNEANSKEGEAGLLEIPSTRIQVAMYLVGSPRAAQQVHT